MTAPRRRQVLGWLLAGAACPLVAAEAAPFRTTDLTWTDTARGRDVPVRLYLPADDGASAPLPLVVFSHGIGGSRLGYRYLGEHWARHGIASLHLQHVGSDRKVWGGNPFEVFGRLRAAATDDEALARVQDLRFALDAALAGEAGRRFDATRIVAAGHSYGANTAMLACGARIQRGGAPLALRDERIAGAVLISAPPFYGQGEPAPIVGGLAVPTLHVTSTDDVIRIPGYYSGPEDRLALFDAAGGAGKWLAVFNEGTHSTFVGRAGEGSRVVVATRELALAFTQRVFGMPGADFTAWRLRHGTLLDRFVAPQAA